jgi:hypothetical protein
MMLRRSGCGDANGVPRIGTSRFKLHQCACRFKQSDTSNWPFLFAQVR